MRELNAGIENGLDESPGGLFRRTELRVRVRERSVPVL